jgi:Fe(3+) dicitrate transport protein
MDLTFNWNVSKIYTLKGGINNLMDVKYATRRASGYPGPGLLPGTGRTIYFSVGIKL